MSGYSKTAVIIPAVLLTIGILLSTGAKVWEDAPTAKATDAPAPVSSEKIYTGEKISLDVQNADIHRIIEFISDVAGVKIEVPDSVHGKVALKLRDVPWDQVLDIILDAHNLEYEESGGVLTVCQRPLILIDGCRQYADLNSGDVQGPQLPRLVKKVFTPNYVPLTAVAKELQKHKSGRGKMVAIGKDIYVEDEPGNIAAMTQVFMRFDRVGPRILIDARIMEAEVSFIRDMDIKWRGCEATSTAPTECAGNICGEDSVTVKPSLAYGVLDKDSRTKLDAQLNGIVSSNVARTISSPRIMAVNDQEVPIRPGGWLHDPQPDPRGLYEFNIKPHIEANGQLITLGIEFVHDMLDWRPSEAEPDIIVREAATKVMIKDGETVAIGGLAVASGHGSEGGVNGCRKLPFWDGPINNHASENIESEMFVIVTATIMPVDKK